MLAKRFKILYLVIGLLFTSQLLQAQPNTIFFMDGIHQSNRINPAYQNPCNGFVGLPVFSGTYVDVANTGFAFNDLFRNGTGIRKDSLVFDFKNLKSKLGKSNYLKANFEIPLVNFGFWAQNTYVTFSITNITKGRIQYPGNLIKLVDGNGGYIGEDNPLEIEKFGPNFINYNEYAIGLSKRITHRLILGGKFKFLSGTASFESRKSDIKIYTGQDWDYIRLATDMKFNFSGPATVTTDAQGMIDEIEVNDFETSQVTGVKNPGMAFDFGGSYILNDRINLFASFTDLGFITWKNNTTNISQKGSFTFSGLTLDSLNAESDYDEIEELVDSISDFFTFNESGSKYTTFMNTNVYVGGTFELDPNLKLGLLSRTFFYDRKVHQGVTLSANAKAGKWFSATLAYTMMNRAYNNLGIGASIKAGPVQFYFVTDNLNFALNYKKAKALAVQFGLNLYFGCGKRQNNSMINDHTPTKDIDFM